MPADADTIVSEAARGLHDALPVAAPARTRAACAVILSHPYPYPYPYPHPHPYPYPYLYPYLYPYPCTTYYQAGTHSGPVCTHTQSVLPRVRRLVTFAYMASG